MPKQPGRRSWDDDDDDERDWESHAYDEEDDVEADDDYDDDEVDTKRCPHCRAEIYEEAEECPECGEYVTAEEGMFSGKPLWIVVTAIVLLGAFLMFAAM